MSMKLARTIGIAAFIAAFVLSSGSLFAQPVIHLFFAPPVSPYLSDWQSRASTATITVDNPGAARVCKIRAEIFINGLMMAFTKVDKLIPRSIPPGHSVFNGEDVAPYS